MSVSSSVLDAIISAQVGCEQSGLCDDVTLRGDSEEEDDEDIRALQEEIRWVAVSCIGASGPSMSVGKFRIYTF